MRSYVAIFVVLAAVLLFGCINPPQPQANNTSYYQPPPVIGPANNTTLTQQPLPADYTVNFRDKVWVNYTLWVDGKVLDTNNATLANESGIYNPARKYEPLSFTVELNKGIIDGFVLNVIGMKVNEMLRFSVDPERGYGPYDPQKVITMDRYYNMSRYYEKSLYETVPRSYLESQGLNITKGAGYATPYGTVFIDSFNDTDVTLFYILVPGGNFTFNGIPQTVVNMTNLTATMELMLADNETYLLSHPTTGERLPFKVVGKNDQNITMELLLQENYSYVLTSPVSGQTERFKVIGVADQNYTLDSNHALANKTLDFQVTLLKVERPTN